MASIGRMLKYLKHSEIDKTKWDNCVKTAVNPLVYSLSSYLDIIHPLWEAFIYEYDDEYLAVMPLLSTTKMGFKLHKKPILAQQLGLIYTTKFEETGSLANLIDRLTQHYQLFDYPLNYKNNIVDALRANKIIFETHATQILSLNQPYQEMRLAYRRDRKSRLNQALKNDLKVCASTNSEELLELFSENVSKKIPGGVNESTMDKIQALVQWGIKSKIGKLYVTYDHQKNPVSAGYFTLYANRLTYLFGATSINGKSLHANTLLLDFVIQQYAGTKNILDFEGSSIEGIKDFYKSFGSLDEHYTMIKSQSSSPVFKLLFEGRKRIYQLLNPAS